jgi:hypothetical protein
MTDSLLIFRDIRDVRNAEDRDGNSTSQVAINLVRNVILMYALNEWELAGATRKVSHVINAILVKVL